MTQPSDTTMQVSFAPSQVGMPNVEPVTVELVGSRKTVTLADFTLEQDITDNGSIAVPLLDNPFNYLVLFIQIQAQLADNSSNQYMAFLNGDDGKSSWIFHLNTLFSEERETKIAVCAIVSNDAIYAIANKNNSYMWTQSTQYSAYYKIETTSSPENVLNITNCSAVAGAKITVEGITP